MILYHSYGGNTKDLAKEIEKQIELKSVSVVTDLSIDVLTAKEVTRSKEFDRILDYDVIILGSNTWGDGDMPPLMRKVCDYLNQESVDEQLKDKITAVFGTGETGYHHYCASVNMMTDLLRGRSNLIVTLKVEQLYCSDDMWRIETFAQKVTDAMALEQSIHLSTEQERLDTVENRYYPM